MRSLGKSIPAESERVGVIQRAHSEGHFGVRAVVEKIYNAFNLWWPSLREDVQNVLRSCSTCQKYDVIKRGYHPPRSPNVTLPGDWWQIDLIHMPTSLNGYSYVLVIIDLFTSFVLTRPLKTKSAQETAHSLLQVWGDWGPPKIVQTDAGSEFLNEVFEAMSALANVELRASTPYYKHSTGSVERVNRTIGASLRKMLQGAIAKWDTILPIVQYFYNTTVRSLSKSSPYALMFANPLEGGENPIIEDFDIEKWSQDNDFESWLPHHRERLEETIQRHKRVLSDIYPAIQETIASKRRKSAKKFAATHTIVQQPFEPGTKVLVLDERKNSKHDQNWVGPFTVESVNKTGSYILADSDGDTIRRARAQMKLFHEADDQLDQKSYQLERIIKHRGHGNNVQYLVKWTGYSHQHNSWLKPSDFDDTKIITDYWQDKAPKRSTAPRRKSQRRTAGSA
jgi:transposase InsO family protein